MSASKSDKCRFWIAIFLDDIQPNTIFHPGLLHLTLIPWFVSDQSDLAVIDCFKSSFSGFSKFELCLSKRTTFGPKDNIAVSLVQPSEELTKLHQLSLDCFDSVGGRWAVKNPYVDAEFLPHIRRRPGTRLAEGQVISVTAIDLVKARREEDHLRELAAKVELV